MTGYTVHTGATEQFVAGYDLIFGKPAGTRAKRKKAAKSKPVAKKKSKKKT